MVAATATIMPNDNEIQEDFVRASGPGGQNVKIFATFNATRQLRFRVEVANNL